MRDDAVITFMTYKQTENYKRLIQYTGGDAQLYGLIKKLLKHRGVETLVEVFGGSGVVTLYSKYPRRVYNDFDSYLANMMRMVRDRPDDVAAAINKLVDMKCIDRDCLVSVLEDGEPHEAAAAIIIFYHLNTNWQWSHRRKPEKRLRTVLNKAKDIHYFSRLLQGVVIENMDFREVVKKYDSPTTLFYMDPPWFCNLVEGYKYYRFDLEYKDHVELYRLLDQIKGFWLLKENYCSHTYLFLTQHVNSLLNLFIVKTLGKVTRNKQGKPTPVNWIFATNYDLDNYLLLL